jgi:hypothetical protein
VCCVRVRSETRSNLFFFRKQVGSERKIRRAVDNVSYLTMGILIVPKHLRDVTRARPPLP